VENQNTIDVGALVSQAWEKFVANIGIFLVMGLIFNVVVVLSIGLAVGYLSASFTLVWILLLREDKLSEVSDLFGPGRTFLPCLLFILLMAVISALTFGIGGIIFGILWMYTIPLIAEKDMSLGDAMKASKDKVKEIGFGTHFIILLAVVGLCIIAQVGVGIISFFLGSIGSLVGIAVACALVPLTSGIWVGAYVKAFPAGDVQAGEAGQEVTAPYPESGDPGAAQ